MLRLKKQTAFWTRDSLRTDILIPVAARWMRMCGTSEALIQKAGAGVGRNNAREVWQAAKNRSSRNQSGFLWYRALPQESVFNAPIWSVSLFPHHRPPPPPPSSLSVFLLLRLHWSWLGHPPPPLWNQVRLAKTAVRLCTVAGEGGEEAWEEKIWGRVAALQMSLWLLYMLSFGGGDSHHILQLMGD